jgi:hypothetical protein
MSGLTSAITRAVFAMAGSERGSFLGSNHVRERERLPQGVRAGGVAMRSAEREYPAVGSVAGLCEQPVAEHPTLPAREERVATGGAHAAEQLRRVLGHRPGGGYVDALRVEQDRSRQRAARS